MSVVSVVERLEAMDVSSLGRGGVHLGLADVARVQRFLDGVKVRLIGRADELAAAGGSPDGEEAFRSATKSSASEAKRTKRAAETAAAEPELGAALERGTIGLEHLALYGQIAEGLDADQQQRLRAGQPALLAEAGHQTPEQFRRAVTEAARQIRADDGETRSARQRRERSAKFGFRDLIDGMGFLTARWDPETAERVFAHLRGEVDRLRKADPSLSEEQAAADAVAGLILGHGRATQPGRVEVVVFIDWDSLLHGAHESGVSYLSSGVHLPVSTVRRLCCEAEIIPMVLGGAGVPLDLGRGQRLANRDQRRALRKLYRGCAYPGCEVAFDDCHIHHVDPWDPTGRTDLLNLVPLCSKHHHRVHEGGWTLAIDATRTLVITRPDGGVEHTVFWAPPAGEAPRPYRAGAPPGRTAPPFGVDSDGEELRRSA